MNKVQEITIYSYSNGRIDVSIDRGGDNWHRYNNITNQSRRNIQNVIVGMQFVGFHLDPYDGTTCVVVKPSLKLYVWEGVFADYSTGIAFALAESNTQAQELIMQDRTWGRIELESAPIIINNTPYGTSINGGG